MGLINILLAQENENVLQDQIRRKNQEAEEAKESARATSDSFRTALTIQNQKSRDLLFAMAIKSNKFKATIDDLKKKWPDKAAEIDDVYEKAAERVDSSKEYQEELKEWVEQKLPNPMDRNR